MIISMIALLDQALPQEIVQALSLVGGATDKVNTLWNFLAIVILGILGFVYKDKQMRENSTVKLGLSIGFAFFAIGNFMAISDAQRVSFALGEFLRNSAPKVDPAFGLILSSYKAINVGEIQVFHVSLDLLVLFAIWLPNIAGWRQVRRNK